ncbi:TonB family protein [Hymenobacter tenuis]
MPLPNSSSEPTASASRHLPVEVLRRYVAGTLEPAEQHRVEAHTLDCEQCADVLAGLELQPAAVTDASLLDLRQRLGSRVAELAEEAKPVAAGLAWRKLAAAAVLLLTLGAVAWFTLHRTAYTGNEALATRTITVKTAPPPAAPHTLPLDTTLLATSASTTPDLALNTPPATRSAPLANRARRAPSKPVRVFADKEVSRPAVVALATLAGNQSAADASEAQDSGRTASSNAAMVAAAPSQPAAPSTAEEASKVMARSARSKASAKSSPSVVSSAEATRTVRGRITDQASGTGLPGVTVLVPGTQQGVSTAQDGSFTLTVPAATDKLLFSSIGYTTKTQALRPTDSTLALALAPDSKALSEVVVVRRDAPPMPAPVGAMPAGGYAGLKKYLRDSLDYPEKALEARQEGNVKLHFVVGVDGKLSDIKVVKKLSEECDAEAIRLLQEGPAWFPAIQNGRRTARTVEITVPFKLEDR